MARHIITGSGAPATAPENVGQHYIDTAAGDHYLAIGTTGAGDWKKVGSGGGLSGYGTPVTHQALTKSGAQWFWDVAANPLSRVVTADLDTDLLLQLPDGADKHYQGALVIDNLANSGVLNLAIDPAETGTWTVYGNSTKVTDTTNFYSLGANSVNRLEVQIHLDASGHRNMVFNIINNYQGGGPLG